MLLPAWMPSLLQVVVEEEEEEEEAEMGVRSRT
jgi:hypothetical protein